MPKCDFNKVAPYFHNTFSWEYLWTAASEISNIIRGVFRTQLTMYDGAFSRKFAAFSR